VTRVRMARGPSLSARVFPWLRGNGLDGPPSQARDEWAEERIMGPCVVGVVFFFLFLIFLFHFFLICKFQI
jgi:hypothetical protein